MNRFQAAGLHFLGSAFVLFLITVWIGTLGLVSRPLVYCRQWRQLNRPAGVDPKFLSCLTPFW